MTLLLFVEKKIYDPETSIPTNLREIQTHDSNATTQSPILPDFYSTTMSKFMAKAINLRFAVSVAPAAVSNPQRPQNTNHVNASVITDEFKAAESCGVLSKPGSDQAPQGMPIGAVFIGGPGLILFKFSSTKLKAFCIEFFLVEASLRE